MIFWYRQKRLRSLLKSRRRRPNVPKSRKSPKPSAATRRRAPTHSPAAIPWREAKHQLDTIPWRETIHRPAAEQQPVTLHWRVATHGTQCFTALTTRLRWIGLGHFSGGAGVNVGEWPAELYS